MREKGEAEGQASWELYGIELADARGGGHRRAERAKKAERKASLL